MQIQREFEILRILCDWVHCHQPRRLILPLSYRRTSRARSGHGFHGDTSRKRKSIPDDHIQVCEAAGIACEGNAAGNTGNYLDLKELKAVRAYAARVQ